MKSVTLEEFKKFDPCWLKNEEDAKKLEEIGRRKEQWTALDILALPDEEVSAADKLWAVLREELIDASVLHEFACRCAEEALKLVDNPDPRSVAAIEAKRKWLRGEIGNDALQAARVAAWAAAWDAASAAAWDAAWAASAAAWDAASDAASEAASEAASAAASEAASAAASEAACAAREAACAAREAARAASAAARVAAWASARSQQIEILKGLVKEGNT